MSFTFVIQDVCEIHRDPGGHYHHWTFLVGVLETGTMQCGDRIFIPCQNDTIFVSRILGFEAFRRDLGQVITSNDIQDPIGVCVGRPAPPNTIAHCCLARSGFESEYEVAILRMLQDDPTIFFHYQGSDRQLMLCSECKSVLYHLPQAISHLYSLLNYSDRNVVHAVEHILNHLLNFTQ